VLDTRSTPGQFHHLAAGLRGAGLPALLIQPRTVVAGESAADLSERVALAQEFATKLGRLTRLALEEVSYFQPDGQPVAERADDAAYLLSLAKTRPSVLLPGRIADEPLSSQGSALDADWQYQGLAQDLRDCHGPRAAMLPGADGSAVLFDLPTLEARAAPIPASSGSDFGSDLFGEFPALLIRIPGVAQPVRVAHSVAVWYPEQRRLIRIVWSDATQELRQAMHLGQ
jgi:hypothetical protein